MFKFSFLIIELYLDKVGWWLVRVSLILGVIGLRVEQANKQTILVEQLQ